MAHTTAIMMRLWRLRRLNQHLHQSVRRLMSTQGEKRPSTSDQAKPDHLDKLKRPRACVQYC
jgi:hypothetical protein